MCIYVGYDSASKVYLNHKRKQCSIMKIEFELIHLEKSNDEELSRIIHEINNDVSIHACIVQLPLPSNINPNIVNLIDYKKDVDGFTKYNLGCLSFGEPCIIPATPLGIVKMIDYYNIPTKGQHVVVIGKSNIVGKPISMLLSNEEMYGATVTMCDKYTENLKQIVASANILIVAAGVHHVINKNYVVKSNATIIDVGIHRILDETTYVLQGDVDYDHFKDKCAYITQCREVSVQ